MPDVAAGLATLGTAGDDAYGKPWMLPCAPVESSRAVVARMSHYLGRNIELTVMPRWAMRMLGPFVPMIREINEMLCQWDEPFVIDDRRFRDVFSAEPLLECELYKRAAVSKRCIRARWCLCKPSRLRSRACPRLAGVTTALARVS